MAKATKKKQEEHLQQHFIPSLQIDRIPVFEASIRRSNVVLQMNHQFTYLNLPIEEGHKSPYMSGLDETGAGSNLGNIEYHHSVAERHPNFVLKFVYIKDLDNVDPLNISRVDTVKESEQGKIGEDVTTVIT